MPDYRSQADILAAKRASDNSEQNSALFRALMQQRNERGMQEVTGQQKMQQMGEAEAAGQRETDRNLGMAKELLQSDPGYNVNLTGGGGVALNKQKPETNPLLAMRAQDQMDRKIHQYSKDYLDTKIPAATRTLEDVNSNIPGGISGSGSMKSVGGLKNLIPGFAVSGLESLGVLDKGAGAERASLQGLANTQIYDASGKAINESEMRRLKEAMGWSPFTSPDVIRDQIRKFGYTVEDKGKAIEAGTNPQAKAVAQERGIPSVGGLSKLLGGGAPQAAAPQGVDPKRARLEELRRKAGR